MRDMKKSVLRWALLIASLSAAIGAASVTYFGMTWTAILLYVSSVFYLALYVWQRPQLAKIARAKEAIV